MAIIEPGRAYGRVLEPGDPGYLFSEHVEFELRVLVEAQRAAAQLLEEAQDLVTDFGPREAGAPLHVFAERGAELLATAVFASADRGDA